MSINYRDKEKSWAWIIQARIQGWLNFQWSVVEQLDIANSYVLSVYLANIEGFDDDEALQVIKKLLENSCRNFNNREKVYVTFICRDLQ